MKHQASHCLPLKCTPGPSIDAREAELEFLLVRDENEGGTKLPTCGEILAACRPDNLRTQERQQIIYAMERVHLSMHTASTPP